MPKVRKISREEAERDEKKLALGEQPTQAAMSVVTNQIDATVFPHLAAWVFSEGWVELGSDTQSRSLIRIMDADGEIWHSRKRYRTIEELLHAAEQALADLKAAGEI